jgi:hypothetical protein
MGDLNDIACSSDVSKDTVKDDYASLEVQRVKAAAAAALKESDFAAAFIKCASRILPCSRLQTGLLAETTKNPIYYCNWIELQFHKRFSAPIIQGAFFKLAERNEILRTGFAEVDELDHGTGSFVQLVFKELSQQAVKIVNIFDQKFLLSTAEEFLHPFHVQLKHSDDGVSCLVHIHHALYDGWSWELLCSDLQQILLGKDPAKRPVFEKVLDYDLLRSNQRISVEITEFWRQATKGHESSLLPNLHGYIAPSSGLLRRRLNLELPFSRVEGYARALGVRPVAIFETAFAYLLGFYADAAKVSYGAVFSGRTIPVDGIEEIIGPCLQVLPHCIELSHDMSIAEAIRKIHNLSISMQAHSEISLSEIRKIAGLAPDTKLFDALFVWQRTTGITRYQDTLINVDTGDELEYGLSLEISQLDGRMDAKATYDTARFPEDHIKVFLEQYSSLISAVLDNRTSASLRSLWDHVDPILLSRTLQRLQDQTNYSNLSSFVEKIAQVSPKKAALAFGRPESTGMSIDEMSYDTLNRRANQVARFLLFENIKPTDLICIVLEKSFDLYIAILGIVKIGAGYLPIMPDAPAGRVKLILEQAEARLGFVRADFSLPERTKSCAFADIDFSTFSDEDINLEHDYSNIAYTVFTSGTTGVPKGVAVTHRNLLSNLHALGKIYPTKDNSKLLQFCSHAFDGKFGFGRGWSQDRD